MKSGALSVPIPGCSSLHQSVIMNSSHFAIGWIYASNPFKIILKCYLCNIQLIYIMSTTAISIRLDSDIKKQFENLCKEFGLSTNAAFNLFARTVVREQAIPFPISLNGSESETKSSAAQKALDRVQSLSAQEAHEWTDEEIDELIAAHRRKKRER